MENQIASAPATFSSLSVLFLLLIPIFNTKTKKLDKLQVFQPVALSSTSFFLSDLPSEQTINIKQDKFCLAKFHSEIIIIPRKTVPVYQMGLRFFRLRHKGPYGQHLE